MFSIACFCFNLAEPKSTAVTMWGSVNYYVGCGSGSDLRKCWELLVRIICKKQFLPTVAGDCGSTVVKVLCYKSEGRWFDSRWCHCNFSLTYSFRSHYGPGVDSASNRNEYQEYFLGVKAAGA